jgi:phospholipid/cholesterol/gamma-HCH transport system substrate-binding protein
MTRSLRKPRIGPSALRLGTIFVTVAGVAAVLLFQKADILAMVRPGETIEIKFAEAHRLRPSVSEVKVAGVGVGIVRSVEREDDGTTTVTVKVDDDALDAIGTAPSAQIRPTTMLGGNYYVEIVPGGRRGDFSGSIPATRTSLPVEFDGVTRVFPDEAREGVRTGVRGLDGALDDRGSKALRDLVESAPETLDPLAEVLGGLQGTQPERDLARLVAGVESASRVMSSEQSRLGPLLLDLETMSRVLEARATDLASTTATMPATLDETDQMLGRLDGVLTTLEQTAGPARPSVQELDRMLKQAEPVIAKARPVVSDLRGVLRDARPTVEDLVPIGRDLDASIDHVSGPVLDRTNGPILGQLLSSWHGTGRYEGGGADRELYKEIGYMFSNLAAANMMDRNGSMISFFPGVGPGSLSGLPFSLEQIFAAMVDSAQEADQ